MPEDAANPELCPDCQCFPLQQGSEHLHAPGLSLALNEKLRHEQLPGEAGCSFLRGSLLLRPSLLSPFVLADTRDTKAGRKKRQDAWDHYEAMWRKAKESEGVVQAEDIPYHEKHHVVDSKDPNIHWSFDTFGPFTSSGGYTRDGAFGDTS